ncbi:MAG: efflux RND transporter permease subunit [Planctomycetes bacterium]|nr:efflux RND transporter permease subunit [Planctomycetota bacterium]
MSRQQPGFFHSLVRRPIALLVLFVTLIVISVIAYQRIPLQLFPSGFTEPGLFIWIPNPGSSAQENEELVARVVEEQLRTLSGIEEMRSWSESNVVRFRLNFSGSADMDLAKAEVRDRVERAWPSLPETCETAGIWSESSDSLPITFFGVKLEGDPDRRDLLMDRVIVPRLEAVSGIGKVDMWGVLEDSVRILLDEDKVAAAGLDLGTVITRLASDNFAQPLGELEDGGRELILRSDMRFQTPEEIAEFPIEGGLRIKDLGRVARVKEVQNQVSRIDGGYAYFGMATKDSQSNVVETTDRFRAAMTELEQDPALAGQLAFLPFFMQGDMIKTSLAQLQRTALEGGLLSVVVLLVFLRRLRLTICVALSIPVSALMAIAWEYFGGGSFNVITMTGITLATGMLVDNAVVVVENILRLRRAGASEDEAAAEGTAEIALAVTLATVTTVIVFLPLIFLTDQAAVRLLMQTLVVPYSISLFASLLLALVFTPVIVTRLSAERSGRQERWTAAFDPLLRVPLRGVKLLVAALRWGWFQSLRACAFLERSLLAVLTPVRWPLALLPLGVAALVLLAGLRARTSSAPLTAFGIQTGSTWLPLAGPPLVALFVAAVALFGLGRMRARGIRAPARPPTFVPSGESLVDMVIELNQRLLAWTMQHRLAASGLTALIFLSIVIPFSGLMQAALSQESSGDELNFRVNLQGSFTLGEAEQELRVYEDFLTAKKADYGFAHWSHRFDEDGGRFGLHFDQVKQGPDYATLEKRVKQELPRVSGHRLRFYDEDDSDSNTQSMARFTLLGPDSRELERLSQRAVQLLERVPGLSDVSSPLEEAPDQIEVRVDRDLAQELGVDSRAVESSIAYALGGFPLPRFQEEGREIPLRIEFDEAETAGLPTLKDLSVFGQRGEVPLSSIGSLSFGKGARSIFRRNGKTSFALEGKVDDPLQVLAVTAAGQRALQELELPRGYSIDTSDSLIEQRDEDMQALWMAFLLGLVLVFLVMAMFFESLLLPFTVLFTVPFALLGSFWALFLTRTPLDPIGVIGMIILAGVVINHCIVLIDRIRSLRGETPDRLTAVLEGSRQRVRPVLMTALTTVVGLLPMITAAPPRDGIDYRSLAVIVAGGLTSATFFTLWVVPLTYTFLDDLWACLGARAAWWLRPPAKRSPDAGSAAPEPAASSG